MNNIEFDLLMMSTYLLTAEEWFVTKILLLSSEEEKKEYFIKWYSLEQKGDFINILESLQNKSIILKSYRIPKQGERFDPEDVEFNKNFIKKFYKNSSELGNELFEAYPIHMTSGGITYDLRNISKKFNSLEDMGFAYGKAIKFNPSEHEKIMDLLEWGKSQNLIRYGICEFIISHKWKNLEILKQTGDYKDITFESVRSL